MVQFFSSHLHILNLPLLLCCHSWLSRGKKCFCDITQYICWMLAHILSLHPNYLWSTKNERKYPVNPLPIVDIYRYLLCALSFCLTPQILKYCLHDFRMCGCAKLSAQTWYNPTGNYQSIPHPEAADDTTNFRYYSVGQLHSDTNTLPTSICG